MKYNYKLDYYYSIKNIINHYIHLNYDKIKKKYNLDKLYEIDRLKFLLNNIDTIKNDIDISKFQIDFINNNKSLFIKYFIWKELFLENNNKKNNFIIKLN